MSAAKGRPPALSRAALVKCIKQFYNFKSIDTDSIKDLPAYDDRNYFFRGEHETPSLQKGTAGYVFKMFNPVHVSNEVVLGISELWAHVNAKGFTHTSHLLNREGKPITFCPVEESASNYAVRILHFIPGEVLDKIDKQYMTPSLVKAAGTYLGRLDAAIKDGFQNAAISQRQDVWDLRNVLDLRTHLPFLDDPSQKAAIEKVLEGYESFVVPKIPAFTKGIIHGDANGMNVILKKNQDHQYEISGLIDFDDTFHSWYVIDIAIFLAYTMVENLEPVSCPGPVEFVGPMLQGYLEVFPLSKEEIDCLYYLVLGRCCQSAVLGIVSYKAEPWNEYLMHTPNKALKLIDTLLSMGKEKVDMIWTKCKNS